MEELRSTETLDREILEDARRKADQILRAAEDSMEKATRASKERTDREILELEQKYGARVRSETSELTSRLPLEQRRVRSSFWESTLSRELSLALASLSRAQQLSVLSKELSKRAASLEPDGLAEGLVVTFSSLTEEEAEALLRGAWPVPPPALFQCGTTSGFPALKIRAGKVAVRVGLEEALELLLEVHRCDLAVALFGDEVLND